MKPSSVHPDTPTSEERVEEERDKAEEGLAEGVDLDTMSKEVLREVLTLTVRRTYKASGQTIEEDEEDVDLEVREFATEPARSGLRVNHTLNMGDYWSASVQVMFEVPHYVEEQAEAAEFVSKTVGERMVEEIERAVKRTRELRGAKPTSGEHPF